MRSKIDSYIGLAIRSKNLVSGYNTCLALIKRKKIKLIIITEDMAENTVTRFKNLADRYGAIFHIYGSKEELYQLTGIKDRGIFGILDENLAIAVSGELAKKTD